MTDLGDKDIGVREGDVLAGKYRVDRVLGVGGMGVVVAAHHVELDERVAIKFLLPEMLDQAECVLRFAREARAAVKIKSEHVARVRDVGKLENGSPYMVMEYLEGEDLTAWISRGPLPIEQAVDFVLQACEAVAEAHSLDIVHRDLKPANLFCIRRPGGQPSIKVLDFGISKLANGPQDVSMTRTSTIIGSPLYMSPEQMKSSKAVDVRTDIWALGVILFELVTGQVPFGGNSVPEVAIHVAMEPTPPPTSLRPDVPPGLEAAICKCLEKDRARRFQNVGELASALVEFGSKRAKRSFEEIEGTLSSRSGFVATPEASPVSAPEAMHGSTIAGWQQTGSSTKRGGKMTIGAIVSAALFVGATATFLAVRRAPPTPPASQAAVAAVTYAQVPPLPLVQPAPPAPAPTAPPETAFAIPATTVAAAPKPTRSHASHTSASTPTNAPPIAAPTAAPPATTPTAVTPTPAEPPKYNPLDHL
ncbi:MAG: serine/threonine protein kinase [Polyangiaceae bacterium]